MKKGVKFILHSAIISALYVVLTYISALFGLSSGAVQLRISEALNAFALFTPAAVPGLFVGCIISNIFTSSVIWDVIFGSFATLFGAIGVYKFRKYPAVALLCPAVANTIIVPLAVCMPIGDIRAIPIFAVGVLLGELVSCTLFGYALSKILNKHKNMFL